MTIYFDMDGTIADLYNFPNWLDHLKTDSALPYAMAAPMLDMYELATLCSRLQNSGIKIGVISWLAKNSNPDYDKNVRYEKREWLKRNFAIHFNTVHIVKYGTPKYRFLKENDILFDDEFTNRDKWNAHGGRAYEPNEIFEILAALV